MTAQSPLEARISFPAEDRLDDAVFSAILKAIKVATGMSIPRGYVQSGIS